MSGFETANPGLFTGLPPTNGGQEEEDGAESEVREKALVLPDEEG